MSGPLRAADTGSASVTELSGLNVKITGDSQGLTAALGTAKKGLEGFQKSAEASAKVFERAFAGSEKAVDQLRRAIDPVYAASKRYEAAVETLDKALKMGTISQQAHTRMLDQASAAYLQAQGAANTLGGRMGFLSGMTDQTRTRIQQMGFQVQDVAIQLAAGTRATTVFAQQGSQILSIFGPVGAVLGTLAAVGLPLLGAAFASAGEEVKSFDDALQQLETSVSELKAITDLYSAEGLVALKERYGEVTIEVMRLLEAQREQALFQTQQDAQSAIRALVEQYGLLAINLEAVGQAAKQPALRIVEIGRQLGMTAPQVRELVAAFQELDRAPLEDKPRILSGIRTLLQGASGDTRAWTSAVNQAEAAIRQANAEGAKAGGWLSSATAGAQNWANALWGAAQAAAAARAATLQPATGSYTPGAMDAAARGSLPGAGIVLQPRGAGGAYRPSSGGGGGGGGGDSNPYQADIEALQQSLMTKAEVELESYATRQEALQAALDQRLITEEEYRRLSEEAQRQHAQKMTEIDAWRYGTALDKAGVFFGAMADAMQGGNEKMIAIGKKFAAVEALINAWRAFNQTLADPSIPFFGKFAAAAKVLAAGMGAVNAIKGGGGGSTASRGVGGASNTNAAPTQSTVGTFINLKLQGSNFGADSVRGLIGLINKEVENGAVLKGIRVV